MNFESITSDPRNLYLQHLSQQRHWGWDYWAVVCGVSASLAGVGRAATAEEAIAIALEDVKEDIPDNSNYLLVSSHRKYGKGKKTGNPELAQKGLDDFMKDTLT